MLKKILLLIIICFVNIVYSQDPSKVGVDEKLGQQVAKDIVLTEENGKTLKFSDLLNGKPIILNLVYYRCPGICSPLMNGLTQAVDNLADLEPGKDYTIITVSFDPRENSEMAAEKKINYLNQFKKKKNIENGWRFFTADSLNIAKITDAVGFRYIKQDNDYIHSGVITFLSPDGRVMRYLYGIDFLPFDVKLALIESSEGRVGSTVAKIVKLCYSFDPEGRKYTLNITRIIGAGMLVIIGIFAIILFTSKKKKNIKNIDGSNK